MKIKTGIQSGAAPEIGLEAGAAPEIEGTNMPNPFANYGCTGCRGRKGTYGTLHNGTCTVCYPV